MKCLSVVTTLDTRERARSMARALVERRLAACAQITEVESFYTWAGAVQNEPEFRIEFKTVEGRYPDLEAGIRELHSYEIPEIHAAPLEPISVPYARWIEAQTGAEGAD